MRKKVKLGKEIKALDHMLMRNLFCQARKLGLDEITVMHGWIIDYLYQNQDRAVFQKDVEKEFSIGRSSATNILQLMEKKGYIRRERVSFDARLKRLVLLDKGLERRRIMERLAEQLDTMTWRGISDEELETFFDVIRKLKNNLKQEGREENAENAGCPGERI